ncbi:hypothetical protein SEUCBS140593_006857 [Sporothrix eucalyptigena]|uniref:SWIRM domain-containing protein n=1 Tax=Sporothrix eucalyptigena TaxID=1812306 RepID=A0ABP0CAK8_9PEZI
MSIAQKPLDIRSLMSPPDAEKINSFSNTGASASSGAITTFCPALSASQAQARTVGNGPQADEHGQISPPLSLQGNEEAEPENTGFREDPILFPDTASPLHNRPLFADNTATIISNHIASRSPSLFRQVSPPRGEDYELVVRMRSQVMQRFNADRRGWLKQQREQLLADKKAAAERAQRLRLPAPVPRPVFSQPVARNLTPRTPKEQTIMQPAQGSSSRHDQLSISRPVHDSASRVAKRANRAPARIAPQVNGIVRHGSGSNQNTARVPGSSPEPRIRTSAPNREDKDFNSVEDYTPPLSTLPENAQCMKADWKSTPLDLTNDPLRHLLHPAELVLAAGLRLDCATYLTSKRRIFVRRLQCERHPKKEFRKTDAQQACNIDVNKASKLWTAYDKVGWLDRKYIEQYI